MSAPLLHATPKPRLLPFSSSVASWAVAKARSAATFSEALSTMVVGVPSGKDASIAGRTPRLLWATVTTETCIWRVMTEPEPVSSGMPFAALRCPQLSPDTSGRTSAAARSGRVCAAQHRSGVFVRAMRRAARNPHNPHNPQGCLQRRKSGKSKLHPGQSRRNGQE
jgi:hypothetical protein